MAGRRFGDRGLREHLRMKDASGREVTIADSSAVKPSAWLRCQDPVDDRYVAAFLSPAQARRLAKALLRFADQHAPKRPKANGGRR